MDGIAFVSIKGLAREHGWNVVLFITSLTQI